MHRRLCEQHGIKFIEYPPIIFGGVADETVTVYCICNKPFLDTLDVSMVEYDECNRWYHGVCVKANVNKLSK